jgi:hypothetical protein
MAFTWETLTTGRGDATAKWSWEAPQAKVLPTGDLEWAPRAFEFKAGESICYIDLDSGTAFTVLPNSLQCKTDGVRHG